MIRIGFLVPEVPDGIADERSEKRQARAADAEPMSRRGA